VAHDGKEALQMTILPRYELVILDLMLPDMSGQAICRQLRAQGIKTAILMLTAMDTLEDKVSGLRLGADDYLTKPFAFEELVARIQALLRRSNSFEEAPNTLSVADLTLDREAHEVHRNGKLIKLTPKEYTLLEYLMRTPGKVLSCTKILDNVWGVQC